MRAIVSPLRDDVYFDGRVLLDVRDRSRRANIGEDEVTVVPNCDGALR
jgi:hypothetical protein